MFRLRGVFIVGILAAFVSTSAFEGQADACGVKLVVKRQRRGKRQLKASAAKRQAKRSRDSDSKRRVASRGERAPVAVGPAIPEATAPAPVPAPAPAEPAPEPPVVAVAPTPPASAPEVTPPEDASPPAPKPKQVKTRRAPRPESPALAPPTSPLRVEVYFNLGSRDVSAESASSLAEVTQWLADNPGHRVVVEGHTDPSGSAAFNQRLSVMRSRAVQQHLRTAANVKARRLKVRGFGESQLAYDANDPKNRRVVIRNR